MAYRFARPVTDFADRKFQVVTVADGEILHSVSDQFLGLLLRECGARWLQDQPCAKGDYVLKMRSLSEEEWKVKLDEVTRVPKKHRHKVRHHRDWINRFEGEFCREFFRHLSGKG